MAFFFVIITVVCTNYPKIMIIVCTNYYCVYKSVYNWRIKGKQNVVTSRERKIRMRVFLYDAKVNSNHGIRLKARMSLYDPLYSYAMLKLI